MPVKVSENLFCGDGQDKKLGFRISDSNFLIFKSHKLILKIWYLRA